MKTYDGMDAQLSAFLTSALDESEWLASRPGRPTLGERPSVPHVLRLGVLQSGSVRGVEENP
jgi:hypothetical protein